MAVYDVTRPLREQLDDTAIEAMIRTHVPELLETFTLEEVLTPKRVIDLVNAGRVSEESLVTYCVHYPYLQIPPTLLGEDPTPAAPEGQPFDIFPLPTRLYDRISAGWKELSTPNI